MMQTHSPRILITGVTGNVGTELTRKLAALGVPFRAMVRSPTACGPLATLGGAELVAGDFNDGDSLAHALKGIDRAFLLPPSSAQAQTQQATFVDAARRADVKHIVKQSQWAAAADSPVRFLRYHAAVEQKIRGSGIAYTFLRPNLFMQGLLAFRDSIAGQNRFFAAALGDARISIVDVRDIAAVAAATLTQKGHAGSIYNLTGPEALTHTEMAQQLSAALGRTVAFEDLPVAAMQQALADAGFPAWQVEGLMEDYAHYARGEAAAVSDDVKHVTGNALHSFAEFAADHAPLFS